MINKAFLGILEKTLWNSLTKKAGGRRLRSNITSLYKKKTWNQIRTNILGSEEFLTGKRIGQTGVSSQTFFIIVLNTMIKAIKAQIKKLLMGYRHLESVYITEYSFADDLNNCAKNKT